MQKTLVALIFAVIEIINYVFGHGWAWGAVTEEEVGIVISAILPFVIWFIPNR